MQDIQAFIQTNYWVLPVASIWETIWKGFALWKAGKKSQKYWFIAILVVNTVGLLPILYLLLTRPKKRVTFKESPSFRKVVFAAMSKKSFYMREHIIKFILEKGFTPTCAFMMYSYFLLDTVERDSLLSANNELIRRSDELWVFGPISDGVRCEIKLAESLSRTIKYFELESSTNNIKEIHSDQKEE